MDRQFLVRFRRDDARSLVRALILLVLISGFLGASHSASMAGGFAGGGIICTGTGSESPAIPAAQENCLCCMFACGSAYAAIVDAKSGNSIDTRPANENVSFKPDAIIVARQMPANAGPRGPPLLV